VVTDGDSLKIRGERIRLHGIDAPEMKQVCHKDGHAWRCGEEAKRRLAELIRNRLVSCIVHDRDRYGRAVGQCLVTEPAQDLNAEMVLSGYALAYREYSEKYVTLEHRAESAKAGMWAGRFDAPWDWRKARR
jgi:endonuclease YncB( thermonuclease family)